MLTVHPPTGSSNHRAAALLGLVLLVIALATALTVDVPRTGPGIQGDIKGDEATYVSAALSAAFDHDLRFERRDLERFEGLYHNGPEGLFLKRGRFTRLYFAKAFIYPVLAAPFVRLLGINGFLVFHVLLLASVAACGYLFLAAEMSTAAALLFTSAFLGASALPAYSVVFMPEVLNLALVFVAYFLWLYKELRQPTWLGGVASDVAAAVLLGLATYSKPTNAGLIAPLVLLAAWRRQWLRSALVGAVFVAVVAAGFGFTWAVTGEVNYQGGDRKTFYGTFPTDLSGHGWERGISEQTNGEAAREMLTSPERGSRFVTNVEYFLVGRDFGFVPYFFPGVIAIAAWLLSRARRDPWRILTCFGFVATAVGLLLIMPYTWSGGGGPTGNRYLLSVYPVVFFLIPPMNVTWPGVLAWIGGALFTAKILVNPFWAAKYPYLIVEKGLARRLPVEVTMANDLPVMLAQPLRARIPYGHDPTMLLYFMDQNAFPPEPDGMWVAGGRRADIIVVTGDPIDHLAVTAVSPIQTVLTLSMGRGSVSTTLLPGKPAMIAVPASGKRGLRRYAYVLSASSSEGFVPRMHDPASTDTRDLGAQLQFSAVLAPNP